ncbi:hypothetical protein [[Clostridium] colinum]|uniref:hypothetical protein n=1 Tax=[Clostridium] colinum TaxID=36835 RepID=UPI0020248751|nr:hypothetical protein [[Clostridium] colinum]
MKKLILILSTIFILILNNSFLTFAASVSNEVKSNFYITGGLDFSKDCQATFDKTRIITGKAEEGSTVTIIVYEKLLEMKEELKELERYKIVVGASGYFSQTLNFAIGENIICVNVKDKNNKTSSAKTSITRKNSEIKNELEQAVILGRTRK